MYIIRLHAIDQLFMLFIFNHKCTWRFRQMFSYKIWSLRVKNLQVMKNLKIYDPNPERSFTKAKSARQWRTEGNGETASAAANQFKNFPTFDLAFGNDFTVLSTFVPTDTLAHLKYCGKSTRKSTDAVDDVHFWWIMLFTLERFTGPPLGNLINIYYTS